MEIITLENIIHHFLVKQIKQKKFFEVQIY